MQPNPEITLTLHSDQHFGRRVPPDAVGNLLRLIPDAIGRSVRMAVEGRSSAPGNRPDWLRAATDIRFLGHDGAEETNLHFEAPTLGAAAPKLYEQPQFWSRIPAATDTGFDLLADVFADVLDNQADSERFDRPLLGRIEKLARILHPTFSALELRSTSRSGTRPVIVTPSIEERARNLFDDTPAAQPARIVGKLDMIRASTQSFGVQLDDGQEVRAVLLNGDVADQGGLLEQRVLVLGRALFRPSGRLLRVDAESLTPCDNGHGFFSAVPKPTRRRFDLRQTIQSQRQKKGLAAIVGQWPGDETDEEIERALRDFE